MIRISGRQAATTLAFVAVCGLVAVSAVSEAAESGDTVREDAGAWSEADEAEAARVTARWTARVQRTNAIAMTTAVQPVDHSDKVAMQQLKKEAAYNHEIRHSERKTERQEAAKWTESVVARQIKKEGKQAQEEASIAATQAAKMAAGEVVKNKKMDVINPEDKLGLLRNDDKLLVAAVAKARQEEADEKRANIDKAKISQADINTKVQMAKKEFANLESELQKFTGTEESEKAAHHQIGELSHQLACLNAFIKANKAQLKRMKDRQSDFVKKSEDEVAAAKKVLKGLLNTYKGNIEGLKNKLQTVTTATDINSELATRITAAEGLKAEQETKLRQLGEDVARLQEQLKSSQNNIQVFTKKAKQRHHLLRVAHLLYVQLKAEEKMLKMQAALKPKKKELNVPRGDSKQIAKKLTDKVLAAVKKAAAGEKSSLLKAAVKAATKAAAHKAEALAPKVDVGIPDSVLNHALNTAGKAVNKLGLGPPAPAPAPAPAAGMKAIPAQKATGVVLSSLLDTSKVKRAKVHGLNRALADADRTVAQFNLNQISDKEMHHAELLAHVAHVLFEKAMATGKAKDHAAAKAAMRAAIGAHTTLGH